MIDDASLSSAIVAEMLNDVTVAAIFAP